MKKLLSGVGIRAFCPVRIQEIAATSVQFSIELANTTPLALRVNEQKDFGPLQESLCETFRVLVNEEAKTAFLQGTSSCGNPNCKNCGKKMSAKAKQAKLAEVRLEMVAKKAFERAFVLAEKILPHIFSNSTLPETAMYIEMRNGENHYFQRWSFKNAGHKHYQEHAEIFFKTYFGTNDELIQEDKQKSFRLSIENITAKEYLMAAYSQLLAAHPPLNAIIKLAEVTKRSQSAQLLDEGETAKDICLDITHLPAVAAVLKLIPQWLMGFRIFTGVKLTPKRKTKAASKK